MNFDSGHTLIDLSLLDKSSFSKTVNQMFDLHSVVMEHIEQARVMAARRQYLEMEKLLASVPSTVSSGSSATSLLLSSEKNKSHCSAG